MNRIKFAIIGCGRIAQRHAEHIHNMGKLIAVCDVKSDKAKILAKKYNCRDYVDLNELLKNEPDIEVVSICTPNGLHADHSIRSLNAGKHVVCEKPMAISVIDCDQMIKASRKAKKNLFIVKQNRFNPPVIALKKIIDEGRLGKIVNVQLNCFWNRNDAYYQDSDWKGSLLLDGGTLFTQFSHFIDLIYWLIGDVQEVRAIVKNVLHKDVIDFEDTGVIILEFKNGAVGTINYTVNA